MVANSNLVSHWGGGGGIFENLIYLCILFEDCNTLDNRQHSYIQIPVGIMQKTSEVTI